LVEAWNIPALKGLLRVPNLLLEGDRRQGLDQGNLALQEQQLVFPPQQ
jgi:hypothetical protein